MSYDPEKRKFVSPIAEAYAKKTTDIRSRTCLQCGSRISSRRKKSTWYGKAGFCTKKCEMKKDTPIELPLSEQNFKRMQECSQKTGIPIKSLFEIAISLFFNMSPEENIRKIEAFSNRVFDKNVCVQVSITNPILFTFGE